MHRFPFLLVALHAAAAAAPAAATGPVPVPAFNSVQLRGGGSLILRHGAAQRVRLLEGSTASTSFRVTPEGQLRIHACNGGCPRGYRLTIEIESPSVPGLALSRGGRITVGQGFPAQRRLSAAVRGGGQIDALTVNASDVSAAVSGGGQLLVWAEDSLNAAVSGSGHIGYRGKPSVATAVRGGGLVASVR